MKEVVFNKLVKAAVECFVILWIIPLARLSQEYICDITRHICDIRRHNKNVRVRISAAYGCTRYLQALDMPKSRVGIRMKWLQVIVHATLVCGSLSSTTVCSEDRSQCYTLVTDKADQEMAISRCRNDGSDLAILKNNTVVSDENDYTLAWINLNRFESGGRVKFVNGSLVGSITGADEGCLALNYSQVPLYECYTPLPFVCSSKYIHNCSRWSGGNCYVYIPSPMSWYRARQYCREIHGGDLAALLSSEDMGVNLTSPSWIGAYSELWKWNNTVEMNYSHWKEDEPNPDWSCAVVNIKTGLWETANCSTSYSYLCEENHQGIPTAAIAGGVIGSLVIIAGIIAAVLIIWKLRSRQKDSRNQDPSAENTNKVIEKRLPGSRGTYQEIDDVVLAVEPRNFHGTYSLESATTLSKPRSFDAYEEVDMGPGASTSNDDYDETNIYSKEQVVLRPDVLLSTLDIDNTGAKASHKVGPKGGIYGLPVKDPNETTVVENYVYEK